MNNKQLKVFCNLDKQSILLLKQAISKLNLSARAFHRVIKIARTIVDLEDSSEINSNHIVKRIEEQIERLSIGTYIEKVIANSELDEVLKGRNRQEKLAEYINAKKLSPKEVLIIGDSSEEVEIANNFGSTSIAISHGHYSTPRIKASKPDYLINDLKEAIGIVTDLNK